MVDTVRTRAELLETLFADGQGAGSITPQDMRDLILSTYGLSGWADYTDTTYTTGSPFSVAAMTDTVIPNGAGTKREQELPLDKTELWNVAGQYIPGFPGDSYIILCEFKIRRASGTADFSFTNFIDIGGSAPDLYSSKRTVNGTEDSPIFYAPPAYSLDTWEANGGQVKINCSVACEIYDIRHVIHRLHRGQGTYPPA